MGHIVELVYEVGCRREVATWVLLPNQEHKQIQFQCLKCRCVTLKDSIVSASKMAAAFKKRTQRAVFLLMPVFRLAKKRKPSFGGDFYYRMLQKNNTLQLAKEQQRIVLSLFKASQFNFELALPKSEAPSLFNLEKNGCLLQLRCCRLYEISKIQHRHICPPPPLIL